MIWFKHDTNAVNDAKVKKLVIRYGAEGYAIYFHCIELIAGDINENNITFCLEHDSEIIADNLKIKGTAEKSGIQIVEEIMQYIVELKLFEERNNLIYCYKLLKRLDLSMTSNVKFRKVITDAKESHDKVMIESCNIISDEIILNNITSNEKEQRKRFIPPSREEIESFTNENQCHINIDTFIDYYNSNGWKIGKNKMSDWKATVRNWHRRDKDIGKGKPSRTTNEDEAYAARKRLEGL